MSKPELTTWRPSQGRVRRLLAAGLTAVAAALLAALGCLMRPPESPPSRPGAALPGGAVVAWSPGYRVSFFGLERLHPADAARYDRVAAELVARGLLGREDFLVPAPLDAAQLAAVHDPAYLETLRRPDSLTRALELPLPGWLDGAALDRRVLAPFRLAAGGTLEVARAALMHGLGVNLGGGFHHARPAAGGGFCVYNDVAAALAALRAEGFEGRVLIVDTDAHQGDGNHSFFADDPLVFSFSIHQAEIFPPKVRGDRDIELHSGDGDRELLGALAENLGPLLDEVSPQLVFHVAGADVLRDDPLAELTVTPDGMVERDRLVAREVRGRGIPLVHLLAGGYGPSSARTQARSVAAILEDAAAAAAP